MSSFTGVPGRVVSLWTGRLTVCDSFLNHVCSFPSLTSWRMSTALPRENKVETSSSGMRG